MSLYNYRFSKALDIVAEWLRRWIANPLPIERESLNLSNADNFNHILLRPNHTLVVTNYVVSMTGNPNLQFRRRARSYKEAIVVSK